MDIQPPREDDSCVDRAACEERRAFGLKFHVMYRDVAQNLWLRVGARKAGFNEIGWEVGIKDNDWGRFTAEIISDKSGEHGSRRRLDGKHRASDVDSDIRMCEG